MFNHKSKKELLGLIEWVNCFNYTAKLFNQELTTAKKEFSNDCELKFSECIDEDNLIKSFRIDLFDDFGNNIYEIVDTMTFVDKSDFDNYKEEHMVNRIGSLFMLYLIHGELGEKMRSIKHKDGTQTNPAIIEH